MPPKNNDRLVTWLGSIFQKRYEPNFAYVNAYSSIAGLPGLRAMWTMGAHSAAGGHLLDPTANGAWLGNINTVPLGYEGLAPVAILGGVNDYFARADGGANSWADCTGGETFINNAVRGMIVGGWFRLDRLTNLEGLIGKWAGVLAQNNYLLAFRGDLANDPIEFHCGNGGAVANATLNFSPVAGTWYFCWGRYDRTSGDITVGVDNQTSVNAATGLGNLVDGTAPFNIGTYGSAIAYCLQGRVSFCELCGMSLSDTIMKNAFHQTRALFGK